MVSRVVAPAAAMRRPNSANASIVRVQTASPAASQVVIRFGACPAANTPTILAMDAILPRDPRWEQDRGDLDRYRNLLPGRLALGLLRADLLLVRVANVGRFVGVEDAVQVVNLVLQAAGEPALGSEPCLVPMHVSALHGHPFVSLDVAAHARDAQTAFGRDDHLLGSLDDL